MCIQCFEQKGEEDFAIIFRLINQLQVFRLNYLLKIVINKNVAVHGFRFTE